MIPFHSYYIQSRQLNQQNQSKDQEIFTMQSNPSISTTRKKAKHINSYLKFPLTTSDNSNPQEIHTTQHKLSIPQDSPKSSSNINPIMALNQFKSTQDQYDMLKKRLQILKLKDDKNNNRYQLNQRKMILHDSIQKLANYEKQRLQSWRNSSQERKEQQRIQNLQQKLAHHKNVQNIIGTLKEVKQREYQHRKEQLKTNQSKILEKGQEVLTHNKNKVQNIKKLESLSKISIQIYTNQKLSSFRDKKTKQIDSFAVRKMQTQQEIKKMLQIQMQMIQRQSISSLMFQESSQKLKQLLNPEINLKSSKVSLKSPKSNHSKHQTSVDEDQRTNHSINSKGNGHKRTNSSLDNQAMKNGFSLPQIKSARKNP